MILISVVWTCWGFIYYWLKADNEFQGLPQLLRTASPDSMPTLPTAVSPQATAPLWAMYGAASPNFKVEELTSLNIKMLTCSDKF